MMSLRINPKSVIFVMSVVIGALALAAMADSNTVTVQASITNGPTPNPQWVAKPITVGLTASVIDPPEVTKENQVISDPSWSWSVQEVQKRVTTSDDWSDASPSEYSISINQPDGKKPDATAMMTFNVAAYWKVTFKASVFYSDNLGDTWSGSGTVDVSPIAGDWAATQPVSTPTPMVAQWEAFPEGQVHNGTLLPIQLPEGSYGYWDYINLGINVYSGSDGITNGQSSGNIKPGTDPVQGSYSAGEYWIPQGSNALAQRFEYEVVLSGSAESKGNVANGELFTKGNGTSAAGFKVTIEDPGNSNNSVICVSEATKTQGSDGSYSIGAGVSLWPPTVGISYGLTFTSDTWDYPENLSVEQGTIDGNYGPTTETPNYVKCKLLASSQVQWGGDAYGEFLASATVSVQTLSVSKFQP